jgi:deazaflavin-dependent oxidoreductase (nitroreductase family)
MMDHQFMRRIFWFFNRFFMSPLFRLGLGPLVGNPFTGYIMVLKTIGRKSGRIRYTPVNYALLDGNVYFIAGAGKIADWYRNIQNQPKVELILPSGPIAGIATDITESQDSIPVIRQLLKNAGFAGFFMGFNPFTVSDETLYEKIKGLPVVCIRPTGVGSGASDSGGWFWVVVFTLFAWVVFH